MCGMLHVCQIDMCVTHDMYTHTGTVGVPVQREYACAPLPTCTCILYSRQWTSTLLKQGGQRLSSQPAAVAAVFTGLYTVRAASHICMISACIYLLAIRLQPHYWNCSTLAFLKLVEPYISEFLKLLGITWIEHLRAYICCLSACCRCCYLNKEQSRYKKWIHTVVINPFLKDIGLTHITTHCFHNRIPLLLRRNVSLIDVLVCCSINKMTEVHKKAQLLIHT